MPRISEKIILLLVRNYYYCIGTASLPLFLIVIDLMFAVVYIKVIVADRRHFEVAVYGAIAALEAQLSFP